MYCKNCGEKLAENAKFCAKCGTKCKETKKLEKENLIKNILLQIKNIDKKILVIIGIILVLIICLGTNVFGKRYTKNMELFRASSSWMYLYKRPDGSNYKYGELLDIALKNSKWQEANNTITITGKDTKTKEYIEIIVNVNEGNFKFISFTKGDKKSSSFTDFYGWIYTYADIERNNGR